MGNNLNINNIKLPKKIDVFPAVPFNPSSAQSLFCINPPTPQSGKGCKLLPNVKTSTFTI